jgi:cell division septum initiation protein DivIVA
MGLDKMSVESGNMTSSLARLEEWAKHSEDMAARAESDRKEMLKDQKEMLGQLTALASTQKKLVEDMAEVKPVTDMVSAVRNKLAGALIVLGFIGAVFTSAFLYFKEVIIRAIWG